MPRASRPASSDTHHTNGNGASLKFNVQDYLTQMEQRLGTRIDEVKMYCPNDRRIARTESLVKWWGSVLVAGLAAVVGVIAQHLLSAAH